MYRLEAIKYILSEPICVLSLRLVSHEKQEQTERQNWVSVAFYQPLWKNLSGQKLIKIQYHGTFKMSVVILSAAICRVSQMVASKWSTEVCNYFIKHNVEISRDVWCLYTI